MTHGDTVFIVIVVAVVAVIVIGWLLYLAAGLIMLFTAFVAELPVIISILLFVLFPPTLVVFLVGLAMLKLGLAERFVERSLRDPDAPKPTSRSARKALEKRRALGYDE